jgi:hypothetical protein
VLSVPERRINEIILSLASLTQHNVFETHPSRWCVGGSFLFTTEFKPVPLFKYSPRKNIWVFEIYCLIINKAAINIYA